MKLPDEPGHVEPAGSEEASDAAAASRDIRLQAVDVAAFVDTFSQGPYNEPVPVSSWREFQMLFGGFDATSEASYAVYLFFENGGEFAWVIRVPDPASSGFALVGAGGERQASPGAVAESLIGNEEAESGIHAIRGIKRRVPGLLSIPRAAELGSHGARVYLAAKKLCEELRMLLLIDPPLLADTPAELQAWLGDNPDLESAFAALHYPRLFFPDALQHGRNRSFGPSGAVAGIFSWLDQERGVWEAPAGLHAALEAVTLTRELLPDELGPLSRLGINPIREFPGHGVVLWGARTLAAPHSNDPQNKYIPIRRFFIALERSLNNDLEWVIFEPNNEPLWARVRAMVADFLLKLWRDGALQGTRPDDAFFVRCDRTTMTQDDIENGRLIVLVGVAVVKAAEFVIIRIQQKTSSPE